MPKRITEVLDRECCQYEDFVFTNAAGRIVKGARMPHWQWNAMVARGEVRPHCKHCNAIHEFYTFTDAAGSTDWDFRPTGLFRKSDS